MLSPINRFIRSLIPRKNTPEALFIEAIRNENSGLYKEALINYENALAALKKTGHSGSLKNRIAEKHKVLHTFMEYQKNFSSAG